MGHKFILLILGFLFSLTENWALLNAFRRVLLDCVKISIKIQPSKLSWKSMEFSSSVTYWFKLI